MNSTTFYDKEKRLDKLSKSEQEDLLFDLINAFAVVKNSEDSALLLHDLLTKREVQNLSKRLRIAKLLLADVLQEDITNKLHCSYATITKVKVWLDEGGDGLRKVISKLPERKLKPKYEKSLVKPDLPKILIALAREYGFTKEKHKLDNFLNDLEGKHLIDKQIRQVFNDEFRSLHSDKVKKDFIKTTSQR
ncbi:hypothetical protein A3A76_02660 [Candidatus Woesebacteria bacterium RIFCSPLOWO2_01_FULL_39_23]|uniref:TrpR like protein, YerC/YecD n=1 Tax=Candidatus Woesebacteria bacterium RIFCSPHIGHO2_01_FULL_40_22 TaxID=1802499 RepID=A0A1F7YLA1_9BACT|nr:MAG: hypothetical protein A2141_01365 [Candidatus Woesebacteria bacterium RBG_16_40_11]OGM27378.1 MAG: hypothetical protein A2628_01065 [Candidatus Woesebacteria bacterium RIFCSPHIGHO2_01_FULL_40_22]OGM37269.1 MAG: hypothetical protein A3E41_00275 [Candidatus Woesebacteria bacterium RIFCSPHIGHO2_12_FULL_38_9]OGM62550.1 MAG: hypothetical protein A3A76_02660 [Candidatus Woesebacteria bacterium RIFCSPLOWO2_01_FULL_39_23]